MGNRAAVFLVASAWLSVAAGARAAGAPGPVRPAEPFPLDLAFNRLRPFSDIERAAISPTGRHVAYGVVAPRVRRQDIWTLPSGLPVYYLGARLRVVEVATGKTTVLGSEDATTFAPAWAPDGSKLAYYSDEGGYAPRLGLRCGRREIPPGGIPDQGPHLLDDRHAAHLEPRRPAIAGPRAALGRGARRSQAGSGPARQGEQDGRPRHVERRRAGPAGLGAGRRLQPVQVGRGPDGHRPGGRLDARAPARPDDRPGGRGLRPLLADRPPPCVRLAHAAGPRRRKGTTSSIWAWSGSARPSPGSSSGSPASTRGGRPIRGTSWAARAWSWPGIPPRTSCSS